MVKGKAGPKSSSLLTGTPACHKTTAGFIATLACSGLVRADCRSWPSDLVSPSPVTASGLGSAKGYVVGYSRSCRVNKEVARKQLLLIRGLKFVYRAMVIHGF